MESGDIKKTGLVVVLSVLINLIVFSGLNLINLQFTDAVESSEGVMIAENIASDEVKTVLLQDRSDNRFKLVIQSTERLVLSIIYEDAYTEYDLYVNGQLKGQNHNQTARKEIAYDVFEIEKNDYQENDGIGIAEIELVKSAPIAKPNNEVAFIIGSKDEVRDSLGLRTMYNTVMFIFFGMILVVSAIAYYKDRVSYMRILLLLSIVAVIKSMIIGELPLFRDLLGITSGNYFYYDSVTGIVSFFLCQVLFWDLFQFKVKKVTAILYLGIFVTFELGYIVTQYLALLVMMHFIGSLLIVIMGAQAYIKGNPYSLLLITTYSIFSGTVLYRILITVGYYSRGYISEMVFSPQIGNLIYLSSFLFVVLMTYINKLEAYRKQEITDEKIALIRGISHDLKLPLSIIKLNNQMIEKYEITEAEKKEYAKTSLEATLELEKMTDNINCYLNTEILVDTDYQTSVKNRLIMMKRQYENYGKMHSINFVVEISGEDCFLPIKPLHFDRMLYNLVDNAFKYNKARGTVWVRYEADKEITLSVEDNGIGMDSEFIKRIFEPFFRIDVSKRKEGTGLGLCVVKVIVDSLNGKLQVESEINRGTKIKIILPRV
ncbi:ATP-binding protein [Acetobacterium carbinolicum]|uniref:sensor histidine kinase n=1 Tax=Acetobacterium carbinolicum TaxID=52690 RepID=UPI0039C97D69